MESNFIDGGGSDFLFFIYIYFHLHTKICNDEYILCYVCMEVINFLLYMI